jgi:hypothetical protein
MTDQEKHHTIMEAAQATTLLKRFVSPQQLKCLGSLCYGEERQFFIDKLCELAELIEKMPKTYETDGQGKEATVWLHYFKGGRDWHITEKDQEPEQHQAFGLANIGYDAELGYISIEELKANNVELDLYWKPCTVKELPNAKH